MERNRTTITVKEKNQQILPTFPKMS